MERKRVRLGDLLREKKLISEEQLDEALTEQRNSGRKLGRVLIDIGAVSETDLHRCLAEYLDIPYVDLGHMSLEPKVVSLLPETHADDLGDRARRCEERDDRECVGEHVERSEPRECALEAQPPERKP